MAKNTSKMNDSTQSDDTTTTNHIRSPFLRLPGELRNMIYEYVAIPTKEPKRTVRSPTQKFIMELSSRLSLLSVNRQIQHEYAPIVLADARINVNEAHLCATLEFLGPCAAHIRYLSVCLDIDDWCPYAYIPPPKSATMLAAACPNLRELRIKVDWGHMDYIWDSEFVWEMKFFCGTFVGTRVHRFVRPWIMAAGEDAGARWAAAERVKIDWVSRPYDLADFYMAVEELADDNFRALVDQDIS